MFNHGTRGRRAGDNSGITNLSTAFIEAKSPQVTINGYFISGTDDKGIDTAGGQTIIITGGGFSTGITGTIGGVTIGAITYISPTQVSFTSPAKSGGLYVLVLTNTNGSTGALVPGIVYSSVPSFTTPAGSIGTAYETTTYTKNVTATSDSSVTYVLASGSLPDGATLNSATGDITGTLGVINSGSTTYNFAVTATDAESQDVTRSFTITISTDVLTWVNPSNNATIILDGSPYTSILNAADGAGYPVSYTANALPTGLTLSSNTISGTPTTAQTISTLLTATADVTTRSQTNTITWVVNIGDVFWKDTLLLMREATASSYLSDASLNNSQITAFGDARPNNFNPYSWGYYSNYFDGTGDYLGYTMTSPAPYPIGASEAFTVEAWVYPTAAEASFIATYGSIKTAFTADIGWQFKRTGGTLVITSTGGSGTSYTANFPSTLPVGSWSHLAIVRKTDGTFTAYLNGIGGTSVSAPGAIAPYLNRGDLSGLLGFYVGSNEFNWTQTGNQVTFAGYISNLNYVKGSALYTANFTPPTTPRTATSSTFLLTCNSNKLVEMSNNLPLTKFGDTQVSSAHPFGIPTETTYNTLTSVYVPTAITNYISVPHNTALTITSGSTDSFIAECWVKFNTVTASTAILNKSGVNGSTFQNWSLNLDSAKKFQMIWGVTGSPGSQIGFISGTTIAVEGVWYHLAYVKTSSTWALFVNGVRETTYSGLNTASDGTTNPLRIGSDNFSGQSINGTISNVRIYKGATATAPYLATDTTLTVPTSPLTAIPGTQLLTCQDGTLKDNSSNGFTVTGNGLVQIVTLSPFTQTTGTVSSLTTLGSTYFDGTGDYIAAAYSPDYYFGTGDFTVEFWYFTPITFNTGNGPCIGFGYGGATKGGWVIYRNTTINTNVLSIRVAPQGGTGFVDYVTTTTPTPNTWTHWAVVRRGTTMTWFRDGVADTPVTNSTNITDTTVGITMNIGYAVTWGVYAQCYLADVRVIKGTALYTTNFLPPQAPLTPVTDTKLLTCQYDGGANNNAFVDQSSFNTLITRNGNTTQGTFSPYSQTGWSYYFPANGSYLSKTNSSLNVSAAAKSFTFETWVFPFTAGVFVAIGSGSSYGNSFAVDWGFGTAGKFRVTGGSGSSNPLGFSSTNTFAAGLWYHVAVTKTTAGVYKLYINAALEGTQTLVTVLASGTTLVLNGLYDNNGLGNNGGGLMLSNLRFVMDTVVYDSAGFAIPAQPLTAITNTSVLTAQSNRFIDNGNNVSEFTVGGSPQVLARSPFGGITTAPITYSNYFADLGATSDYFSVPNSTPLNLSSGDFTIEAWVYRNEVTGNIGTIISKDGRPSVSYNSYQFSLTFPSSFYALTFKAGNGGTANVPQTITSTVALPLGQWVHAAVVKSGSTITIYQNGVSVVSATQTTAIVDGGQPVYIGMDQGQNNTANWSGFISNLRVVKGTALYTANFTPSTTPLTAISGTSLLTCKSATLVDESTNNFAITTTGDVKPSEFNPFGTTVTKNVQYTPSIHGGSMYFDGTGDYLQSAASPAISLGATDFTIEFWEYNLDTADRYLFTTGADWPANTGALVLHYQGGFAIGGPGTSVTGQGTLPKPYQWSHIALVRNGTYYYLYKNGSLMGSLYVATNAAPDNYVKLGTGTAGSWPNFKGYISDLRIIKGTCLYKAAFAPPLTALPVTSQTSFALPATSGAIVDYHSTHNIETVGTTLVASETPFDGSYHSGFFNGSTSVVTLTPGTFGSANFTIELWLYTTIETSQVFFQNYRWYNGLTPGSIGFFYESVAKNFWIQLYTGAGSDFNGAPGGYAASAAQTSISGRWIHLAGGRNGSTVFLSVNGVYTTGALSSDTALNLESRTTYGIGLYNDNSGGPGWAVSGYISNFRIVKGTALYTGAFTPPTAPLTAISGTSLLTFATNRIVDASSDNRTLTNTSVAVKSNNPFRKTNDTSTYFNGATALIVPNAAIPYGAGTPFTVECWMYATSYTSIILLRADGNGSSLGVYTNGTGMLVLSNTFTADFLTATTAFTLNAWNHYAVTRTTANLYTIYLNGVAVGSTTYATALGQVTQYYVAYNTYTGGYSTCYITDFRVTTAVRYTSAFTPPTSRFLR